MAAGHHASLRLTALMSRLPLLPSRRLCAVIALGLVGSQLTACVMFREPIVTAPAPQPQQPAPRSSTESAVSPNPVAPANSAPAPVPTPPPPVTAPPVATRQFQLGA